MQDQADPVAELIDLTHPEANRFLRYSLDLYNHGYFWESHVYFEALWNAHQRTGTVAEFLKGMIKLGAAGVKFAIEQPESAHGHWQRARELFSAVEEAEGHNFLGFDLKKINEELELALKTQQRQVLVNPHWT